jgi:hypothetical protein
MKALLDLLKLFQHHERRGGEQVEAIGKLSGVGDKEEGCEYE